MNSKLTLKLDKNIIDKAKQYAKENHISLSKMIETYLSAVITSYNNKDEITPIVKDLTGVIQLQDKDYQKDYTDYITKKYS